MPDFLPQLWTGFFEHMCVLVLFLAEVHLSISTPSISKFGTVTTLIQYNVIGIHFCSTSYIHRCFRSRSLVLENIFWNISTEFDCAGLSKFYLWYWGTNCKFVALLSILSLFAVGTASSHITKITNLSYMYRYLSIDGADFANVQIIFGLLW